MNLKKIAVGIIGIFLLLTSVNADTVSKDTKKIAITITDTSVVKSGFGLAVANAMQDAGVQSTVFVSADAIKYALKNGDHKKFAGSTTQELIGALIKKGGKVMMCEGFVKLGNIKKTDMVQGIEVAAPSDLAGALYAPNTVTMTF